MGKATIGVLALQGAFKKHVDMVRAIGVGAIEVRRPSQLADCEGVIIPGGESTTILRQLWFIELFDALVEFSRAKPLFGTCAGLILMSQEVATDPFIKPFRVLDVAVERNAFGRQIDSFSAPVEVALGKGKPISYPAVFIRAPRIRHCGSAVEVLASYEGEPILVQEGIHLGATFHPELTDNPLIHQHFVSMVKGARPSMRSH